ncbi:MAG: hypothetical protein R2729_01235 [Bryobacteraceae bacterium]
MMRSLAGLLLAASLWAEPRIVFQKAFPGSSPAWVEIALERDGKAVYKEAPDDPQPIPFQVKQEEADQIFTLAGKVDHFKRKLESGLPVAKMGQKTMRWEDGAAKNEATFNYTTDVDAQAILQWFEKMTETEQHFIAVERAVKFDKLGTNKALLRMQAAMERDRLVGLEQFLPLLERVTKNASFLHMDQERAASLIDWIKNGRPQPAQ